MIGMGWTRQRRLRCEARRATLAFAWITILGVLAVARPAGAENGTELGAIVAAENAYERGVELLPTKPDEARLAFEKAAAEYAWVARQGVRNAGLHYNLANALLQSGDRGGAILEYLRARDLAPADARIAANLAYARTLVPGRPAMGQDPSLVDRLATWWHVVPLPVRATTAAAAWIGFWILLVWRLTRSRAEGSAEGASIVWRYVVGALLLVASVGGITVAIDLVEQRDASKGVVLTDGVEVRKGNGEGFERALEQPLAAGVEFRAIERRPGWVLIRLGDGLGGWVPERNVGFVRDERS
jgi:hypothetical protein